MLTPGSTPNVQNASPSLAQLGLTQGVGPRSSRRFILGSGSDWLYFHSQTFACVLPFSSSTSYSKTPATLFSRANFEDAVR